MIYGHDYHDGDMVDDLNELMESALIAFRDCNRLKRQAKEEKRKNMSCEFKIMASIHYRYYRKLKKTIPSHVMHSSPKVQEDTTRPAPNLKGGLK